MGKKDSIAYTSEQKRLLIESGRRFALYLKAKYGLTDWSIEVSERGRDRLDVNRKTIRVCWERHGMVKERGEWVHPADGNIHVRVAISIARALACGKKSGTEFMEMLSMVIEDHFYLKSHHT